MSRNQTGAPRFLFSKLLFITRLFFLGRKVVCREIVFGNEEIAYVEAHVIYLLEIRHVFSLIKYVQHVLY